MLDVKEGEKGTFSASAESSNNQAKKTGGGGWCTCGDYGRCSVALW